MQRSPDVTEIQISPDLLARIEAVPDTRMGNAPATWTPEQDAALLKYWEGKNKRMLSRVIGWSEKCCRDRYRELIGGRG